MFIGPFRLNSVRAPSGAQCFLVENMENKAHISLLKELKEVFRALRTINVSPATGRRHGLKRTKINNGHASAEFQRPGSG